MKRRKTEKEEIREIMLNISENSENLKESFQTVIDKLLNAGDDITDVSSV